MQHNFLGIFSLILGGSGFLGLLILTFNVGKWTGRINTDINKLQKTLNTINTSAMLLSENTKEIKHKFEIDVLQYKNKLSEMDNKWTVKIENLYKTLTEIINDVKSFQKYAEERFCKIEEKINNLEKIQEKNYA